MIVNDNSSTKDPEEDTPLLRDERSNLDNESEQTLRGEGDAEGHGDKANQEVGVRRGVLIALSMWGLIFLQAANMSGITTTQSRIAEDLDAFSETTWFTSSYLIAMSSTSPLSARLAQIFSPRICVFVASILFAIGGIITSQAPNLTYFLIGRVITGLGGSGIMTISFILVLELTGKERRGIFIGLLNAGFTTGVSFGAVLFGALLSSMGWRFLFWAQAPFALVFGTGIYFSIPKAFSSGQERPGSIKFRLGKIDYLGAFTLTSSICLFLFGLSSAKVLWEPIVVSIVILLIFIYVEICFASDPIIPVTVLRSRGALLSCVTQLGLMAARWSVLFYTPTYAIAIRGWSPASAGSILIPTNAGFALGGIIAGWLHIKRTGSFYIPSIVAYLCFAAALFVLSQTSTAKFPAPLYLIFVFANGLSTGAALNYTLAHLLHLTPSSTHFVSTALLTTFRGFAGSFGSAIGGGFFVRVLKRRLERCFQKHGGLEGREELVRKLLGSPALVQQLTGREKDIAIESYIGALRRLFLAGVVLVLGMAVVQAGTGWRGAGETKTPEEEDVGSENIIEDEEWEEGMARGV